PVRRDILIRANRADSQARAKGARQRPDERLGRAEKPDDNRCYSLDAARTVDSRPAPQRSRQYFLELRCESEGASRQGELISVVAADAGRKFRPGRTRR